MAVDLYARQLAKAALSNGSSGNLHLYQHNIKITIAHPAANVELDGIIVMNGSEETLSLDSFLEQGKGKKYAVFGTYDGEGYNTIVSFFEIKADKTVICSVVVVNLGTGYIKYQETPAYIDEFATVDFSDVIEQVV